MKIAGAALAALLGAVALSAQTPAPRPAATPTPAATPPPAPAPPKPVTSALFFDHTKTADAFAKGTRLVEAPDMIVLGGHREVNGQVEVHDKETDVIYIIDGAATFVTGGKMVDGRVTGPGQWLGRDISGGEEHRLVKGDMMIVPAGMPHWFKQVSPQVSYYVVKVVRP
jgi:mannose-6-phosphate isomerase-like protein (cupin superfamily)